MDRIRCAWTGDDPLYQRYHDEEWGVPVRDDRRLFEKLCLEGAQAGLSWITVLRKRESYRIAFDGFDAQKMVEYDEAKVAELLANPGIIRNKLKVRAAISNAGAFLTLVEEEGSFSDWLWAFVGDETKVNHRKDMREVPATTPESEAMSKALKKRGFKFVGPTICYAFMQSMGMVDDHTTDCFRHSRNLKGNRT
jgi:DNA-3-methyladenine glycosylase I